MGQASWQAAPDGRYWIDVAVGNLELLLMIDLGLVDPLNRVGVQIGSTLYDQLKQFGQLSALRRRSWRDASGREVMTESGLTSVQLIDPLTRQRMGPLVRTSVLRGTAQVPDRVGMAFFHGLIGCKVIWLLDPRLWVIEFP